MNLTLSPTVAVRSALIFCSVAVLFEMWPSLSSLVWPASGYGVSQSDGAAKSRSGSEESVVPGSDKTASDSAQGKTPAFPVVSLLLLVLGIVVVVISIIAATLVPPPTEHLKTALQAAEQRADRAEELARKTSKRVEEEKFRVREAQGARDEAKRDLEEAQRARIHAEGERRAVEERLKETSRFQEQASAAKAEFERQASEIQDVRRRAHEERIAAEGIRKTAEQDAANLRQAAEAERVTAAQLTKKATDADQEIRNRESECHRRESECQALVADVQRREDVVRAEQVRANDKVAEANKTLQDAQRQREDAERTRTAAEATRAETLLAKTTLETLRNNLWPSWVAARGVRPKIDEIEALACGGNANAAILLSYLQVLRAIENHPDINREFNYLWPTVREIGRSLAAMLAESGCSPQESAERLTEWAKALNQESRGRFTVALPALGSSYNSAQMESKNGSIQTVCRVNNWSVSNAKSIMASKAEVS